MKKNSQFDQCKHVKFTSEIEKKAVFLSLLSTPLRTTHQNLMRTSLFFPGSSQCDQTNLSIYLSTFKTDKSISFSDSGNPERTSKVRGRGSAKIEQTWTGEGGSSQS